MTDTPTNYPLCWPVTRPRTPIEDRGRARFSNGTDYYKRQLTIANALDRLQHQADLLDVESPIVSSNVPTRLDGLPKSGAREPEDSGVAFYFRLEDQPYCLACDRWDRAADNIAAIAAHINAMRGQERWVGDLKTAFAGHKALPAPEQEEPWWVVLGVDEGASIYTSMAAYKGLAKTAHPDMGGSNQKMARLNRAREQMERS